MKTREQVDPYLHVLRSVGKALREVTRGELETARMGLYRAFEAQDREAAVDWAKAVRVSLLAAMANPDVDRVDLSRAIVTAGMKALSSIEWGLGPTRNDAGVELTALHGMVRRLRKWTMETSHGHAASEVRAILGEEGL